MTKSVRIQRKRVKGWRMPPNTIYVGRPTKWGNPFPLYNFTPEAAVHYYRDHLVDDQHTHWRELRSAFPELRGKNLACFCPLDQPCHADVLLEIANS